jgi:hypothetical protein
MGQEESHCMAKAAAFSSALQRGRHRCCMARGSPAAPPPSCLEKSWYDRLKITGVSGEEEVGKGGKSNSFLSWQAKAEKERRCSCSARHALAKEHPLSMLGLKGGEKKRGALLSTHVPTCKLRPCCCSLSISISLALSRHNGQVRRCKELVVRILPKGIKENPQFSVRHKSNFNAAPLVIYDASLSRLTSQPLWTNTYVPLNNGVLSARGGNKIRNENKRARYSRVFPAIHLTAAAAEREILNYYIEQTNRPLWLPQMLLPPPRRKVAKDNSLKKKEREQGNTCLRTSLCTSSFPTHTSPQQVFLRTWITVQ